MPTVQQRPLKSTTPKSHQACPSTFGKENNRNVNNLTINDPKNAVKKPLSPFSKTCVTPKVKKI